MSTLLFYLETCFSQMCLKNIKQFVLEQVLAHRAVAVIRSVPHFTRIAHNFDRPCQPFTVNVRSIYLTQNLGQVPWWKMCTSAREEQEHGHFNCQIMINSSVRKLTGGFSVSVKSVDWMQKNIAALMMHQLN